MVANIRSIPFCVATQTVPASSSNNARFSLREIRLSLMLGFLAAPAYNSSIAVPIHRSPFRPSKEHDWLSQFRLFFFSAIHFDEIKMWPSGWPFLDDQPKKSAGI